MYTLQFPAYSSSSYTVSISSEDGTKWWDFVNKVMVGTWTPANNLFAIAPLADPSCFDLLTVALQGFALPDGLYWFRVHDMSENGSCVGTELKQSVAGGEVIPPIPTKFTATLGTVTLTPA